MISKISSAIKTGVKLRESITAKKESANTESTAKASTAKAKEPAKAESATPAKETKSEQTSAGVGQTTAERLLATPTKLSGLISEDTQTLQARNATPNSATSFSPALTLPQALSAQDFPGALNSAIFQLNSAPEDTAHQDAAGSADQAIADEIVEDFSDDIETANSSTGSTRENAILSATDQLERVEQIDDPEIREQVLTELAPGISNLGQSFEFLNDEQADTVITSLTKTAESLGPDQADLLAEPLAGGLESVFDVKLESADFAGSITDAIVDGHGALLGTRLSRFLPIDGDGYGPVSEATAKGINSLNEDFSEALEAKQGVDSEVQRFIHEFGDVLSEEEIQKGVEVILDERKEIIEEYESQAARVGTTLDAVSSFTADPRLHRAGIGESKLWDATQGVRENFEAITNSETGQELLTDAIAESADGEANFFTNIGSFASSIDGAKGDADKVANLVVRSVAARASVLIDQGNIGEAVELFEGLDSAAGVIGVTNPAELGKLTDLLKDFEAGDLTSTEFADQFSVQASKVKGVAGPDGTSGVQTGFKLLGIAVGVASLVSKDRSDAGIEDYLRDATDGAGLLGEIGGVLPKGSTAADFLGKVGKLAKAGTLFDALGVVNAFRAGDIPEAGIALAGLVGGILVSSSSIGPVGTAIGAVLSVGAVVGSLGLGAFRKNQAEDDAEELLGKALQAAGFEPEEANLLRDVSGDTHQSIGLIFNQIAETNPDFTARNLLDSFLDPGSAHGGIEAGVPLADGDTSIVDNRRALVDLIEDLPRDDNGNFTSEAVQEAIVHFEQNLGISIDPSGLNANTALDALDEEFTSLDLNGDGQVSKGELEDVVDQYNQLNEFIGPLTPEQVDERKTAGELAGIANYFLNRESFLDRVDVGYQGGSGNDKISRDDIATVQAQNEALQVVFENRNVFDTSRQNDPNKADGEISKGDLEAVRDGDYPQELKDAAKYLLDNGDFFDTVDTSDPDDVDETEDDDNIVIEGNGKLTFRELALARLGLNG